jgi:hypothetical protein
MNPFARFSDWLGWACLFFSSMANLASHWLTDTCVRSAARLAASSALSYT